MTRVGRIVVCILSIAYAPAWSDDSKLYGEIDIFASYFHADPSVPESLPPPSGVADWITGSISVNWNLNIGSRNAYFFTHDELYADTDGSIAYTLYEAYASITGWDALYMTFGIKHLTWGLGLVFSPCDRLNRDLPYYYTNGSALVASGLDLFDSTKQQNGFPGLIMSFIPTDALTITAAVSLDRALSHADSSFWEHLGYGSFASLFVENVELFASFVYRLDETFRPGAGISFEVLGFVINLEGAIELDNPVQYPFSAPAEPYGIDWDSPRLWKPFFLADCGIKKIISTEDFSVVTALEYLYADTGYSLEEETLYLDGLDSLITSGGDPFSFNVPDYLGKHYVFGTIGFEKTNLLSVSGSGIFNATDGSLALAFELSFTGIGSIDLDAKLFVGAGQDPKSEFRKMPRSIRLDAGVVFHF